MSDTTATVQTGQESAGEKAKRVRKHFFEVAKDADGKWHWMLWSPNGRKMATNEIAYDRRKDALSAIESFRQAVPEAQHVTMANDGDDE